MTWRPRSALLLVPVLLFTSCGDGRDLDPVEVREAACADLDEFVRFRLGIFEMPAQERFDRSDELEDRMRGHIGRLESMEDDKLAAAFKRLTTTGGIPGEPMDDSMAQAASTTWNGALDYAAERCELVGTVADLRRANRKRYGR